jgi:hypothetical protein
MVLSTFLLAMFGHIGYAEVPVFNGEQYTGRLVQITNPREINGNIYFNNALNAEDRAVYVITKDTYIDTNGGNLGIDRIADGLYAQTWHYTDASDTKELLKIEIMENAPHGFGAGWKPEILFSDVPYDSLYYDATYRLSKLNIMEGYGDGQFQPDAEVTRAEMVKILLSLLHRQDEKVTTAPEELFTDVNAEHWAYHQIYTAKALGLTDGNGDGTFAPEEVVTMGQAVKFIVSVLGCTPMVDTNDGYPYGYMKIAVELGLTRGLDTNVDAGIKRGTAAQLVSNALNVPFLEPV